MDTLTRSLKALPSPALQRDLTAGVLARVETIAKPRPTPVSSIRSQAPWAIALGSALAAAAIAVSTWSGDASLLRVTPFGIGGLGLPSSGVGAVTLLVGLAVYAAGLFAPIRRSTESASGF